ncbi:hypothetical protein GF325_03585 [Candidatus Bathyarchaeota archaeon]|nr:hypothetical protein [Candidatus Bathyarchaeota archaeon]
MIMETDETESSTSNQVLFIAISSMFIALTAVVTLTLRINFPASGGYFNLGEVIIFMSALLFGRYVGALAGGVGAAIADLIGYPIFAPGTLVVKALEGFIIGYLVEKIGSNGMHLREEPGGKPDEDISNRIILLILGFIISTLIVSLGWIFVPEGIVLWLLMATIFAATMVYASVQVNTNFYSLLIAISAGVGIMITGYFVYEAYILRISVYDAFKEIPINLLQGCIGIIVVLPIHQAILKSGIIQDIKIVKGKIMT